MAARWRCGVLPITVASEFAAVIGSSRSQCSIYRDIRESYEDMDGDKTVMKFFDKVLKRWNCLYKREKEENRSKR